MSLNPEVSDLPEQLSVPLPLGGPALPGVRPGGKRLLLMGTLPGAGGGCACSANALLKAVLAHLILDRREWVLVDMDAGVEHLGRGTVASVDAVVLVSEPSLRSLSVAAEAGRMAADLGLARQVLALNRCAEVPAALPDLPGLPGQALAMPPLPGLAARQLTSGSVLGLPEDREIAVFCARLLDMLQT
jgi:CO dehydrogenase maturation factor